MKTIFSQLCVIVAGACLGINLMQENWIMVGVNFISAAFCSVGAFSSYDQE